MGEGGDEEQFFGGRGINNNNNARRKEYVCLVCLKKLFLQGAGGSRYAQHNAWLYRITLALVI